MEPKGALELVGLKKKDYKRTLVSLIETTMVEGASDLHLSVGYQPSIRVSGSLIPLVKMDVLTPEDTLGFLKELVLPKQFETFVSDQEIDFSYTYKTATRFRGNASVQQGAVSIALRLIPSEIKSISELGLPPILETFANKEQGFFLVVGPVGQGKSTTLAAMVDLINATRSEHVVTIEDPIEYVYQQKQSIIDQREVGIDTRDFKTALVSSFRQDVNVILVGEMRDAETIATAVTAAETGHLVLSTLHTNNAAQTIDRIIDSFPGGQQDQIRTQLAASLLGIFSQRLVPRIAGGLIPACELLINNSAIANLIRERRTHELNTVIETSSDQGMITMNRSLADLVRKGEITVENAYRHSINPKLLEGML